MGGAPTVLPGWGLYLGEFLPRQVNMRIRLMFQALMFVTSMGAVFVAVSAAQDMAAPAQKSAVLMAGVGNLHHPTSTGNAEAQQFFDQGLRLIYAFNHDEADRSFHRALELDPKFAMAWWGVAVAVGPNYNLPVDAEHEKVAVDAVKHALELSRAAPAIERDYIEAMATRFTSDANPDYRQLNVKFSEAMRALAKKYPDDLDAATLFADSLMNLRPWQLWKVDGTPEEGTAEILATLESVLRRDPHHVGAMHLYLHAVEASPNPERALHYADEIAALAPNAGHLVHMPSHIYMRTGNYDGARARNVEAAKVDEAYIAASGAEGMHGGMYGLMYYSHNLHFLAVAAGTEGRCAEAVDAAERLAKNVEPALGEMPDLAPFAGIRYAVDVRCRRWDELLGMKAPSEKNAALRAFWLYAHGSALAVVGKMAEAEVEEKELAAIEKATPREAVFMLPIENHSWEIYRIADDLLAARIAGRSDKAIVLLRDAVMHQDHLLYNEPPDWYFDVRETLGGALLGSGDVKGAEAVFRESLARNPRNPRSLLGLAEALKRQGREYDAAWVKKEFETAWQGADVAIEVGEL
jgi:tetratricopeptide (TPR) repeat protein